jgi:hypothetical protein
MTEAVAPLSTEPEPTSLAAVARGLVQLLAHRAGRGPTHAKALWAGEDTVLVLFGGGYTKAEQTLWAYKRPEAALAYRQAVLDALEDDMRNVLEAQTGRSVSAVLACARYEPEVMAVVFLLEPLGGSGSLDAGLCGAGGEPAPHDTFGASPRRVS